LPRKGGERAAAVVRALGPGLGSKARGLGARGARSRAARRPGPHVSAPVHGETLPGASTTGGAAQPTLLVLASRVGGAAPRRAPAARPRRAGRGTPLSTGIVLRASASPAPARVHPAGIGRGMPHRAC